MMALWLVLWALMIGAMVALIVYVEMARERRGGE